MRSLVPYAVLALVIGSLFAAVPLRSSFSLLQKYEVKADIVYVYLNVFAVNESASGLGGRRMLAYVIVLSVANLNDKVIRMRDANIVLAESAQLQGNGVSIRDSLVSCYRYLPQENIDYFWYPNSTKLITFSGVSSFPDYGEQDLLLGAAFDAFLEIMGRTPEGAFATSGFVLKRIQLEALSQTEYFYDTVFGAKRFVYTNDGVDIVTEWSNRTVNP